jgi:hypothetical protein
MEEKNDYQIDENSLLSSLFALPKMANVDGFLYSYFKSQIERSNGMPDERRERLDIVNHTYNLTNKEVQNLNNGKFEYILKNPYNNFHNLLREFFTRNHNFYDIEMIKTFSKAIYFLKDLDKYNGYNQGKIANSDLNRNHFLSAIKRFTKELISELEWRINRLDPLNYKTYNPTDEELKMYFDSILTKGLILRNWERFTENFESIYASLVPKYFSHQTSKEDLKKMFSNRNEIFIDNIIVTFDSSLN